MAYSTSAPPIKLVDGIGGSGAVWYYTETGVDSDVDAADYFTNGDDLGMKVGDVVHFFDSTTPMLTYFFVSAVTSGGAATVIAGTVTV